MNMPSAPERGPLMVVLYDVLNTQVADQLSARAQMLKFLEEERRAAHRYLFPRRPASPSAGLHVGYRSARASGESNRRFIIEGVSG